MHKAVILIINHFAEDLLRLVSTLLDKLLDLDETLCSKWSCESFVSGVCEASEECRYTIILLIGGEAWSRAQSRMTQFGAMFIFS